MTGSLKNGNQIPEGDSLVPKLKLGNPVQKAPAFSIPGSWSFQDGIPKLELGNERKLLM